MESALHSGSADRDGPDEVRDILADRARRLGQSLQGYLLELVKSEAERAGNVALLQRFEDRDDGAASTMGDTVRERDAERAARDAGLGLDQDGPGAAT